MYSVVENYTIIAPMEETLASREIYQARIDAAIAFISTHLADDLSLEKLARAASFSPFHFHRVFTTLVDETPHDFVNSVRLEAAANLLTKAPSLSITEVALTCGFSSSAAFARSFKKHFGVTASNYAAQPLPPITVGGRRSHSDGPTGSEERPLAIDVQVEVMPRFHLAYVSNLCGYNLPKICKAWGKLIRWASAHDLITPETRMIGISFDDPLITPEDKCRYYACITVPPTLTFDPSVGLIDIPEGKFAVSHAACDAEEIQVIYRHLFRNWLPESGYQPGDRPSYEIYQATPEMNPEGKFILDICIPIKPL